MSLGVSPTIAISAVLILSVGGHSINKGSKELSVFEVFDDALVLIFGIIIRTPLHPIYFKLARIRSFDFHLTVQTIKGFYPYAICIYRRDCKFIKRLSFISIRMRNPGDNIFKRNNILMQTTKMSSAFI